MDVETEVAETEDDLFDDATDEISADEGDDEQGGEVSDTETDEQGDGETTEAQSDESDESDDSGDPDESTNGDIELPSETDLLRMQLEQAERRATRWQQNHDALTGKLGPELQMLREKVASIESGGGGGEYYEQPTQPQQPTQQQTAPSALEQQVAELRQIEVNRAIAETANSFKARFPAIESLSEEMREPMKEAVAEIQTRYDQLNPAEARDLTENLLTKALAKAVQTRQAGVGELQKTQLAKTKKRRESNRPVGVGQKRPAPQIPKDPSEQTEEELAAYFKSQGRRGF